MNAFSAYGLSTDTPNTSAPAAPYFSARSVAVCSSFVQIPLNAAGKKISTTLRPRSDDSATSSPFSSRSVKSGAS